MSNFESLDNTFGITPAEVVKPIKKERPKIVLSDKKEDQEKDYQYARGELYSLIDKMSEAVNGALEVAQESDHPRAYEVAMNGAKNAAEVVEKLQDLHRKWNKIEDEEVKVATNNTQNNIYMTGSTADLMKLIKDGQKAEDK